MFNNSRNKFLAAASLGTFLEFLDFMLYAFMATIIAHKFFPAGNHFVSMISTWGIFALGFFARPLGAIFFGSLGDRLGVRRALILSMGMMSLATASIGLIPSYDRIGIIAPILLMVCRIVQGFSISPEYNGAATYLSLDKKNDKHFGLLCSLTTISSAIGMMTGGIWVSMMTAGFTADTLPEWRWRLPFVVSGLLVGGAGIWLRLSMTDLKPKTIVKSPLVNALKTQWRQMLFIILISAYMGIVYYTICGYAPAFLQIHRGYSVAESSAIISKCGFIIIFSSLFAGWLSDRIGGMRVLQISAGITVIFSFIAFYLLYAGSYNSIVLSLMAVAAAEGMFAGILPSFIARRFKAEQRCSGSAISYNIGVACLGGLAPTIMTLFSKYNPLYPGYVLAILSLIMLYFLIVIDRKSTTVEQTFMDEEYGYAGTT